MKGGTRKFTLLLLLVFCLILGTFCDSASREVISVDSDDGSNEEFSPGETGAGSDGDLERVSNSLTRAKV